MSSYPTERIDRASKLPLYHQLYVLLRGNIMRGDLEPGDALPTESELMERYEVSRTTVRQALDILVNEGLIYRQQGQGTFVAHPTLTQSASRIVSFTEDMRRRGLKPGTQILDTGLVPAPDDVAEALQIRPGEEVSCLERLRLADGEPISLEKSYLVHVYCPGILGGDYAQTSLRQALELKYGIRLVRAKQTIRAIVASREVAKKLSIRVSAPLLFIERVSYSQNDIPVEFLQVYHRGDRYVLYSELQGYAQA